MPEKADVAIVVARPKFHAYFAPLGFLYISSILRESGARPRLLFVDEKPGAMSALAGELGRLRPSMVVAGTSYKFHNNCPSPTISAALSACRAAKKMSPGCRTVLAGPLNALIYPSLLKEEAVDCAVLGEPEEPVRDVWVALAEGRDLEEVDGLACRDDSGAVLTTFPARYPDLDTLPFPDRDSFDMESTIQDTYFARRAADLLSSRGCPFNCTYCFGAQGSRRNEFQTGRYYRAASPERVVEEVELLYRKWGVRGIKFQDTEFCVSKVRIRRICELLLAKALPDLSWRAVTRVTSVGDDLLRLMRMAGCGSIYYGVESGDEERLAAMNKKITLDQVREVFESTRRAGIRPEASFLIGVPGDTVESINRTIEFALDLKPFLATFHVFVPFPGTLLEKEYPLPGEVDLDGFSVYEHDERSSFCEVPTRELHRLCKAAYRRFYLRPSKVAELAGQMVDPNFRSFVFNSVFGHNEGSLLWKLLTRR